MFGKFRIDWKTLILILGVIVALLIGAKVLMEPESLTIHGLDHNPLDYEFVYYQETVKEIAGKIPALLHRLF